MVHHEYVPRGQIANAEFQKSCNASTTVCTDITQAAESCIMTMSLLPGLSGQMIFGKSQYFTWAHSPYSPLS
uniref:Uncharacterized protein n=1 Tax=Arion vulgaris TaxID=1028688 RepID=A0A0B6Z5W1_9EUPU